MRSIVLMALALLVAAIVAAPLVAEASTAAAVPLYTAFSWVCHQRPQRTWHLGAYPLAVCVRCLGIYTGALAGAVSGLRFSQPLWASSMALLGVEWLAEALGGHAAPALVRFAVGAVAGFFLIPALWGNTASIPSVVKG